MTLVPASVQTLNSSTVTLRAYVKSFAMRYNGGLFAPSAMEPIFFKKEIKSVNLEVYYP